MKRADDPDEDQLAAERLASYPPLTAAELDQLAMIMHGKHYDELPEPDPDC